MCNLNATSQLLRIIFGIILLALVYFGPETDLLSFELMHLWNFGWFGLVPLITGIAAFCPIYAVFGHGNQDKNNRSS